MMLGKLVTNYFQAEHVAYRRLTFYWVQMLRQKGVVGAERGFLSEEALAIIMLTFLQKNFLLPKAQLFKPEGEI